MSKVELPNEKRVVGACVSVVDSAAALIKMPEGMAERPGGRGLAARACERRKSGVGGSGGGRGGRAMQKKEEHAALPVLEQSRTDGRARRARQRLWRPYVFRVS